VLLDTISRNGGRFQSSEKHSSPDDGNENASVVILKPNAPAFQQEHCATLHNGTQRQIQHYTKQPLGCFQAGPHLAAGHKFSPQANATKVGQKCLVTIVDKQHKQYR